MEIIIGSEGMGVPWGKKVIEYMIQKIKKIKYENTPDCDIIIKTFGIDLEPEWNTLPKKYNEKSFICSLFFIFAAFVQRTNCF